VTHILDRAQSGDPKAAEELLPLVYEELRKLAAIRMANEPAGQTLQATTLVHEAWLRLVGPEAQVWSNRYHFFAAAAEAMRRILIDNARREQRPKHGHGWQRVDLDQVNVAIQTDDDTLLLVDEALTRLEQEDPPKGGVGQVVVLRRDENSRSGQGAGPVRIDRQKNLDLRPSVSAAGNQARPSFRRAPGLAVPMRLNEGQMNRRDLEQRSRNQNAIAP